VNPNLLEHAKGRRVEEPDVPAQRIDDYRPPARGRVSQAEGELLVEPRVVPREVLHARVFQQALQLALRAKVLEDQRVPLAVAAGPKRRRKHAPQYGWIAPEHRGRVLPAELVDSLRRTPGCILFEEGCGLENVALARIQEATQRILRFLTRRRDESDAVLFELRRQRRHALRLPVLALRGEAVYAVLHRVHGCGSAAPATRLRADFS